MSGHDEPRSGPRDKDSAWLDALAGRTDAHTPATREGAALREAIVRAETATQAVDVAAEDSLRESQLLARARREGLLGAPERRSWLTWPGGFAVAALAGVAVVVGLYLQTPEPPEVVRSAPDGIVRIEADDPVELKHQIIDDLRAAGVDATGYELLGRQGIDADLPRPLPDAVRRVLEKYRIAEPADGVLRVEITARPSR